MSILAYCISYVIWAIWTLTERSYFPSGVSPFLWNGIIMKTAIWLGPISIFLYQKKKVRWYVDFRTMFTPPFPCFPTVVGLCMTVAFLHTAHILVVGLHVWGVFQGIYVVMSLSAALLEELVFRGLYFNLQAAAYGTKRAAMLNGLIFALYHFPQFLAGQDLPSLVAFRFWMIAVMGYIFSLAFARWKHLGMTMVIHFVWNLLCYWFALI